MNGNPPQIYSAGQGFVELPGCWHSVAENASGTEDVAAVVSLVVERKVVEEGGYAALTVLDPGFE